MKTRKEQVEKEAKAFLKNQIVANGGNSENFEDYISEFFWNRGCLYASINQLDNPKIIAGIHRGLII